MIYTTDIALPIKEESKGYYFLAGSIDLNLPNNWRKEVIEELEDSVHFFDPIRVNHEMLNNAQMREHIEWELDALSLSDKILLNFLPDSKSPISLVELGLYAKTDKLIVVCPDKFYLRRYVSVLCNKYNVPFFNSLDKAIQYLKKSLEL